MELLKIGRLPAFGSVPDGILIPPIEVILTLDPGPLVLVNTFKAFVDDWGYPETSTISIGIKPDV